MGPKKVLGVIMPERESSPESKALAMDLVRTLRIEHQEVDLTPQALEALGAYEKRDSVVRRHRPVYAGASSRRHRVAAGPYGLEHAPVYHHGAG